MPTLAPPVRDERHALREFLAYQQSAFVAVAYGLTDDQARSTPTVSALSIGGLIKHVTGVQRGWMQRVAAAPHEPPADDRPFEERAAEYQDEYVMRPDETLAQLLDALTAQNAESLRLVETADLDAAVPVPRDAPWFPATSTPGRCDGCSSTCSPSWPGMPGTPTSSAKPSTAQRCTSSSRRPKHMEPQPWLTPWKP